MAEVLRTDDVTQADRFAQWRHWISATFVPLECAPVSRGTVPRRGGALGTGRPAGVPGGRRTAPGLADPPDDRPAGRRLLQGRAAHPRLVQAVPGGPRSPAAAGGPGHLRLPPPVHDGVRRAARDVVPDVPLRPAAAAPAAVEQVLVTPVSSAQSTGSLVAPFLRRLVANLEQPGEPVNSPAWPTTCSTWWPRCSASAPGCCPRTRPRCGGRCCWPCTAGSRPTWPTRTWTRPRSPGPTTSPCATCTGCSTTRARRWPAGCASGGWPTAAATWRTPPWPSAGCRPSPGAGASRTRPTSARSSRPATASPPGAYRQRADSASRPSNRSGRQPYCPLRSRLGPFLCFLVMRGVAMGDHLLRLIASGLCRRRVRQAGSAPVAQLDPAGAGQEDAERDGAGLVGIGAVTSWVVQSPGPRW